MLWSLKIIVRLSFTDVLLHSTPATKFTLGTIEVHELKQSSFINFQEQKAFSPTPSVLLPSSPFSFTRRAPTESTITISIIDRDHLNIIIAI
jgi:hypothetical protein